jgi:hypothetical protein
MRQMLAVLVVLVLGAQEEKGQHPILRVEMEQMVVEVVAVVLVVVAVGHLLQAVTAALA